VNCREKMVIRYYQKRDHEDILELFRSLPEYFTSRAVRNIDLDLKQIPENEHECLVYCKERKIFGVLIFRRDPMGDKIYEIKWLAVRRDYFRNGVGKSLVSFAESLVKDKARLIVIYTSNHYFYNGTHKFFEKLGYKKVSIIPDFWDDGDDRVVYWKRVDPIYRPLC
jgi:ribosomal protein S18 acetylase RimI-like enzyme